MLKPSLSIFSCLIFFQFWFFQASAQTKSPAKVPAAKTTSATSKLERAEVAILKKLFQVATDPAADETVLFDTLVNAKNFPPVYKSAILYPGAVETSIKPRNLVSYRSTTSVSFNWIATLVTVDRADTVAFEELVQEQAGMIRQALTNRKDTVTVTRTPTIHTQTMTWKLDTNTRVNLQSTIRRDGKDEVTIEVISRKVVPVNREKFISSIYTRFATAAENALTRRAITNNFLTLAYLLKVQGMQSATAAEKCGDLFKKIAERDIISAFDIIMDVPDDAFIRPLRSRLTATQNAEISKLAQRVVDDFYRKQNPVAPSGKPGTAMRDICKENISRRKRYTPNAHASMNGKDYIYLQYDCMNDLYQVAVRQYVPARKSFFDNGSRNHYEISYAYFDAENTELLFGRSTKTMKICVSCRGSGWTSHQHNYSRTEYGIYNKYEYSGTTNVTQACTSCRGMGIIL